MPRHRLLPLSLLLALSGGAACSRSEPAPVVLGRAPGAGSAIATFEGSYDPATGKLTFRVTPALDPGGLSVYPSYQDGSPGSGPDDTLELVTEASPPAGARTSCPGGTASFDGTITLRSFYRNQSFSNVYIELTSLTPSGFEGCNSDSAPQFGASAQFGLWSYGSLGPKGGANASTRTWSFHYPSSQQFTFAGRILGELGAPVYQAGGPEFDWSPSAIVMPGSAFVDALTTTAHFVWNGSGWIDTRSSGVAFQTQGTIVSQSVGLWDPAKPYAANLADGSNWFLADPAHGGNAIDTSGDFTVCAKFKPGAQPVGLPDKILVAKGKPLTDSSALGWALMQSQDGYAFYYRTSADWGFGPVRSFVNPGTARPDRYTYDYVCGGRAASMVYVGAHGWLEGGGAAETGSFTTSASTLGLSIGAYPDGTSSESDGGVYEVIFDSRGATYDVMKEIVSDAEGRKLFPAGTGVGTYSPFLVPPAPGTNGTGTDGTPVTGADGGSYDVPLYGTVPLPADARALLQEGTVVEYGHPLALDTSATGFCVGMELVADGDWTNVVGGVVYFAGGSFNVAFESPGAGQLPVLWFMTNPQYTWNNVQIPVAWSSGSAQTIKACADPTGTTPQTVLYYVDAAQVDPNVVMSTAAITSTITNFADPASTFRMGTGGNPITPLSGARIRRVFACGGPDPAVCN